jgi:hypothetical protein
MKTAMLGKVLAFSWTLGVMLGCETELSSLEAKGQTLSGYSLSTDATSYYPSAPITVSWEAPADHSGSDWVAMYAAGASNNSYLAYQYVPAGTSGTLTFNAPTTVGTYEFRYLHNNGYTSVTSSNSFIVQAPNTYVCRDLRQGDPWYPTWVHCCDNANQTQSYWIWNDGHASWYGGSCYSWGIRP